MRYLKNLAIGGTLGMSIVTHVLASDPEKLKEGGQAEAEEQKSFVRSIGRPVSMAVMNPPPGFIENMYKLDSQDQLLVPLGSGPIDFRMAA